MPTTPGGKFGGGMGMDAIDTARLDYDVFTINSRNANRTPLVSPSGSVSKFDLKAPGKAKKEYERGYQLLQRKDLQAAIEHLSIAIRMYANFVAAHNALGTAYLELKQAPLAHEQFAKAVAIDDHLPNSFLNLGIAELALKQYSSAEESMKKASSLAPLDLQLSLALVYAEFTNRDYSAVIATAHDVHAGKHNGAEMVHYYAAAAWSAQGHLSEAQRELETLLREAPQSPSADQFRQTLNDLKLDQQQRAEAKLRPVTTVAIVRDVTPKHDAIAEIQRASQDEKERRQITEAEAADAASARDSAPAPLSATQATKQSGLGYVFRSSVDEVDVFFSATDHGKSVTGLTPADVRVLDNGLAPNRIIGFRNELQLPLRLGLVIDTSDSVKHRLPFEQKAALKFLHDVLTDSRDLAFVIGVNNSVLMVQDFTREESAISHALNDLAPGGGTSLWDAVSFASEKLGKHPETQPVARILVVISDGQDNSSSTALKETIASALRNETVVFTVSTRELLDESSSSVLGDHALRTLSELTGGAAFVPGSIRRLSGSLADVQQVIRGRYLLTYQPAGFQPDGSYRPIKVEAERDGREVKVFARKGYYASAEHSKPADPQ